MFRTGWALKAAALLAALACGAAAQGTTGAAPQDPWQDARLIRWSGEMNAGQFDQALHEVEEDLVSPLPHPFDIDIWCRLHLRQHDIDKATAAIENPALKKALGVAPRIFSLDSAGKTGELRQLRQQLSASDIHGSLTYRILIGNAIDATEFDEGFDLAVQAIKTQEPSFLTVWLTINLAENDLRVHHRLEDLLKTNSGFASAQSGKALAGMLDAEKAESATSSCRDRVADADRQFVKVADDWLAVYPGDAGALQFRANHEGDLNGDSHALEADINAALASYPLLRLWSGLEEALRADLLDPNGRHDDAARALALQWSVFESSIPAEQQAKTTVKLSSVMRGLSGCDVSPRITTARLWVDQTLSSTPAAYQAPLDEELAELDMANPEKPAHAQAVIEARNALAIRKNLDHTTVLIQALEKDGKDAENAEALQLYRAALSEFPDHSEWFYEAGNAALQSLGTCDQRVTNWRAALQEFPNATWAMNQLAFAEAQSSQTQDALKTMAAMFEITDPWKGSLATLQTLWAETDGMPSLDAERAQLFASHPKQFRGTANPQQMTKVKPAALAPQELELVPQIPPVSQLSKMTESADRTLIAVAESDGVVSLWRVNARSGQQGNETSADCEADAHVADGAWCARLLRRFLAHPGQIDNLRFSPGGEYLVTSSEASSTVKVWDVATGGQLWYIHFHPGIRPFFALHSGNGGDNKIALLFRQPDTATSGTAPVSGWSTLMICGLDAAAPCTSADWYSSGNFGTNDNGALAWSANGNRLLARVSSIETLIIDTGSMRLIKNVASDTGAVYKPDLSAELYSSIEDAGTVALKTRALGVDAKATTAATANGTLQDKEYLADGTIRFVMQTAPEVTPDTGDSGKKQAATSPAAAIQIIEVAPPTASGPSPSKIIASIPLAEFPVPVLQFSTDAPDRLTILSSKPLDASNPLRAFAVGSLSAAEKNGIELLRLPSKLPPIPNSIAFGPDGRELFVARGSGHATRLDVWDLADSGRPATLAENPLTGPTVGVAASRLWTCAETRPSTFGIVAYDLPRLHPAAIQTSPCYQNGAVAAAPGNRTVAWQDGIDSVNVVPAQGAAWSTGSISNFDLLSAIAVKDDTVVAVTEDSLYTRQKTQSTVSVCDAPGVPCPTGQEGAFSAVALSTDGRYMAAAIGPHWPHTVPAPAAGYGVLVYDLTTGATRLQTETAQPLHVAVTAVSFLPNSTLYAAGTAMGHVFLGDAANPSFGRAIGTENAPIAAMNFSADGHLLAVALESGSVVLFKISADGQASELAQLDSFDDGDWSVVDRTTQQYDASHAGKLSDLLWVYGTTTIELDQMISNFYRDHLLPKLLAFDPVPVTPSPALDPLHIDLPPSIRIVSIQPDLVLAAGTPIAALYTSHRIRVLVNNSPVNESEMKIGGDGLLHVAVSQHHTYALGRENHVSVYVDNTGSTVESRGIEQVIEDKQTPAPGQAKAQFYAIIAGISDYAPSSQLRQLPLADIDARAMALAVSRGAAHLVGDPSLVHILLLTSDEQQAKQTKANLQAMGLPAKNVEWMKPSHANFLSAFEKLKAPLLGADDVFLMFLAGHGMTLGTGGDKSYAYPTLEMTDVSNPAAGTYLSEAELEKGVQDVGASHTILLFDTCDAGNMKVDSSLATNKFSVQSYKVQNSIDVLLGAAADTSAYDNMTVGHGFLTNSLLASMRDSLNGNVLAAGKWLNLALEQTKITAKSFGLQQTPVIYGQDDSLKVAKLPTNELDCIPDVEIVPLAQRPEFHRKGASDDLRLSDKIVEHWTSEDKPAVLYDDGTSSVKRIALIGEYTTDGGQLTMDVQVFYGGSTAVMQFPISVPFQGDADSPNLDAAVEAITQKVDDYARTLKATRKPWTPPSSCFAPLAKLN
jgi:WD40 repeat protein